MLTRTNKERKELFLYLNEKPRTFAAGFKREIIEGLLSGIAGPTQLYSHIGDTISAQVFF